MPRRPPSSRSSVARSIVRVCRELTAHRMFVATDGNVSGRLDRSSILITRRGLRKGLVRSTDLVRVTIDGPTRSRRTSPSSELPMHLAVYAARPDVGGIVHAHPPYATTLAAAGVELTPGVFPEVVLTLGAVPLIPYSTPSTDEVGKSLVPHLSTARGALLANHGAVTWAGSVDEAYLLMEKLEHAAQLEVYGRLIGGLRPLTAGQLARLREVHPYSVNEPWPKN